jgi:hypothetical protein
MVTVTTRIRNAALVSILIVLAAVALPAAPGQAAASPAASTWPQFGQNPRHLNVNPDEHAFNPGNVGGLKVTTAGHYGANVTSSGGPAVANGIAYIGDSDGNLSAFAVRGCGTVDCEPLWQGRTGGGIHGTPAVTGNLVLAGSTDHFLYAFPAGGCGQPTCQPRWKGQLADGPLYSSPAVSNGIVYIGDFSGQLSAFAVGGCGRAVCKPLWVGPAPANTELISSPAVGGGNVYIGGVFNTPDDTTGSMLVFPAAGCGRAVCKPSWTADLGGPVPPNAAPVIAGGKVFMGSSTRFGGPNTTAHLFAFPAAGCGRKTCGPLQSYDVGEFGIEAGPSVVGDTVFVTTATSPDPSTIGVIAAYSANGCRQALCPPLWTGVNFADGFMSQPAIAGGVVFVAKGPASGFPVDAGLYTFDARGCGGTVCLPLSFLQFSDQQFYLGAPVAVAEGHVITASQDNNTEHSNLYIVSG